MKLFAKYNRVNVSLTIIIFLLGSLAFAFLLQYVIINQIDEDLKIEKNEIITYVHQHNGLPDIIEVHDQYTTYQSIVKPKNLTNKIYTHNGFDRIGHERGLQRTIEFNMSVNDHWYLITVSKSLEGTDKLIQTIITITLAIILLILATTFFINRIILRRLWRPFYNTLQNMRQFSLGNAEKLSFDNTDIDEFNYLNETLSNVFSKAQFDYQMLKEFTENASHELQTPIAVIQAKLDILIQNERFSEAESQNIQSAYNALQGLSKLNRSLLLLAKIENKQFDVQSDIKLKELLEDKLNDFAELWKSHNITFTINLSNKSIKGNRYLTEILLNNLLNNATKHNQPGGIINVLLIDNLRITNTGINHALDEKHLYKRFSRQSNLPDSYGLGLSIIQQICYISGFSCTYNFQPPNHHSFMISF